MGNFYDLMEELIKEELNKNKDYTDLKEKYEKLNDLKENAYHNYVVDPQSDFPFLETYDDEYIDKHPKSIEKFKDYIAENENKLKKAFFPRTKRKLVEEIERCETLISKYQNRLKRRDEYRAYKASIGDISEETMLAKINTYENDAIKKVVNDNKHLPEVDDMILTALENNGEKPSRSDPGFYRYYESNYKLADRAEEFIYEEAKKVIIKEKYQEKIDQVKANFENTEDESEIE